MTATGWWNLGVWGGWLLLFLGLELPAVITGRTPWSPLSDATWSTEAIFKPLPWLVVAFLTWLMLHIVVQTWR